MVTVWLNDRGWELRAGPSWLGLSRPMQDGGAEPSACQEGQLDLQAALAHGMPEGVFGLADPVLNTVLVQDEPFRGGLVAAVLLEKYPQGVAQPGMLTPGWPCWTRSTPGSTPTNSPRERAVSLGPAVPAMARRRSPAAGPWPSASTLGRPSSGLLARPRAGGSSAPRRRPNHAPRS